MLSLRSLAACGSTALSVGFNQQLIRQKHSARQVKRIFKRNPARRRIEIRDGLRPEAELPAGPSFPAVLEPEFLPNGWCPPPPEDVEIPSYPFKVARTKNKPNDAVGFLPVYSEFRKDGAKVTTRIKKVTGDRDAFLNELRSVLQIPIVKNPKDDTVRIRTGGTIELKGNRTREVKEWLAGLGF
mmetsp:Transcript_127247/g.189677  ORF Transcript_127247/g.189677 Transcript_127247/m.189677 type:complete len:184 (+) Transcript_127247:168-719(+)